MDKNNILKIGMVADLSENGSIHSQTFKRAVAYIRELLLENTPQPVELLLADDRADAKKAQQTANYLMKQNVDVVVGHFSSSAAKAACQVYQGAEIPILLPAATALDITRDYDFCFQICPDDSKQIKAIKNFILAKDYKSICFKSDINGQAQSISNILIQTLTHCRFSREIRPDTELVIFIGRYHKAVEYLQEHRFPIPILLTDDCFHQELLMYEFSNLGDLYISAFDDHSDNFNSKKAINYHIKTYNGNPGSYFIETIVGAEIALALSSTSKFIHQLKQHEWQTSLGKVCFEDQKNKAAQYNIWKVNSKKFIKLSEESI